MCDDRSRLPVNQFAGNPDIIVKGGYHSRETVVGNDICEVVIFDYIDGYSTTRAIKHHGNR